MRVLSGCLAVLVVLAVGCSDDESGAIEPDAASLSEWCEAAGAVDEAFGSVAALGSNEIADLRSVVNAAEDVAPDDVADDVAAVAAALDEARDLLAAEGAPAELGPAEAPPDLLSTSEVSLRITEFNEANCGLSAPADTLPADQVIDVGPGDDARVAVADALVATFGLSAADAACVAENIDFGAAGADRALPVEELADVFSGCGIDLPTG